MSEQVMQGIEIVTSNFYWVAIPLILAFLLDNVFLKRPKHYWNIRIARRTLNTLKEIDNPAKQFAYLRKVNPFVFEEMILTALKHSGHKIQRNKRYTGDGGIDGKATINGVNTLIQAKRYKGHITASQVSEFATICSKLGKHGLFIHTGRTGKQSWVYGKNDNIDIVSGRRLLSLLTNSAFTPRWKRID